MGAPAGLRLEFCRGRILSSKLGNRPFLLPATSLGARGRRALRPAEHDPTQSAMGCAVCVGTDPGVFPPETPPPVAQRGAGPSGRGGTRRAARRRRRAARGARGLAVGGYTRGPWQPGLAVGGEPRRTRRPGRGRREVWGPMADVGRNREKWLPLDTACTRAGVLLALQPGAVRIRRNPASTTGLGTGRCCPDGGLLPDLARYRDFTITIDYGGRGGGAVHLLQANVWVCNACYSWGGRHPNFHPLQVLHSDFCQVK